MLLWLCWSQMCCFVIGAFGAWGRLVWTPKRRRVRHWGLVKGTLVEDFLLQLHDWGKCQITHLLIFWFFSWVLMLFPLISQCTGCLVGSGTLYACFLGWRGPPLLQTPVGLFWPWPVCFVGVKVLSSLKPVRSIVGSAVSKPPSDDWGGALDTGVLVAPGDFNPVGAAAGKSFLKKV